MSETEWGNTENEGTAADNYVPFEDDVVTPEKWAELTNPRTLPVGQYRFKVDRIERLTPQEGQVGGDKVHLSVIQAPDTAKMPEGGWPSISRLFKKYANPTEGQQKSQYYDARDKAGFIKACGVEPNGESNVWLLLLKCVDSQVLGTVTSRDKDGRTFTDVGSFRPIAG
jgi:hypothetical protein